MKEALQLPNITHPSTPVWPSLVFIFHNSCHKVGGEDEAVQVSLHGTKPEFDFPPRDHVDLGVDQWFFVHFMVCGLCFAQVAPIFPNI